jgi:hypothetical protein
MAKLIELDTMAAELLENQQPAATIVNKTRAPLDDRRRATRFPIERLILFQTSERQQAPISGLGQTINISSSGVLFSTDESLSPGRSIRVAISWPAQLDSSVSLQLVARGRIVRCDGSNAAVRIQRYEFRTRPKHALNPWIDSSQAPPPVNAAKVA